MQHHHEGGSGGSAGGGGGGGGAPPSLCGYPNPQGEAPAEVAVMSSEEHQKLGDLGIAEAASPISSRPPAPATIGSSNFEELMRTTAAEGGSTSGNRWPRQETLALLQIRSEMDAAFRDATVKGPLWEQVSRKLAELGYKRSAKKCKEKFENVHKYYKRTKEGRAGRQDGKSYKFFTQLEALHHNASTSQVVVPRIPTTSAAAVSLPPPLPPTSQPEALLPLAFGGIGISFSSNSSSSSSSEEEDDEHDEEQGHEMEMESADHNRRDRKRKRSAHVSGGAIDTDERMMEFFEGLMKQVMQKQEAMQQRFLEAIEKREQDRMIREEAWKRQDMARIAREHDLMAQERAHSASRDAAIIAFLEKITGQKIHLPTTTTVPLEQHRQSKGQNNQQQQQQSQQQQQQQQQQSQSDQQRPQRMEMIEASQVSNTCNEIVPAAIPEQQIQVQDFTGGGSTEGMVSSRWPKAEVLALIQLRSGMESKYQEAGPKGPFWEEISAGMQRIGYNRSAKRCKEKWENINKYFKKVKESNKKRPEDAKTCPYFHELDALYRRKIHGNTSGINLGGLSEQQRQQQDLGMSSALQSLQVNINVSEDKDGGKTEQMQTSGAGTYSTSTLFGGQSQGDIGEPKQPEDMLRNQLHQHQQSHMMIDGYVNVDGGCNNSDDLDDDEEEVNENEEYDDHHKSEEEMKMAYKIQFQRQNVTNAAGTPPNASSFIALQGSVISST